MWESLIGLQGRGFGRAEPSPGGGLTLALCVSHPHAMSGHTKGKPGCVCGAQVVEYVAVCGVLHCHGSNARALGLGDVVRSLAMGPLRALS